MREIFSLNADWIYVAKKSPQLKKSKVIPKLYDEITLPHSLGNDKIYDYSKKAIKENPDGERKTKKAKSTDKANLAECVLGADSVISKNISNDGSLDNNSPRQTIMWYRRDITINPEYQGKLLYLDFEGVFGKCDVYFNGRRVISENTGLLPFRVNVTKLVSFGKANSLAVRVDCRRDTSSLPGEIMSDSSVIKFGGIHKNVKLLIKEKVHFKEVDYSGEFGGGRYIYNERVEPNLAVLGSKMQVANRGKKTVKAYVVVNVYNMKDELVAKYTTPEQKMKSGAEDELDCSVHVEKPIFWTPSYPYLYKVMFELFADGGLIDRVEIRHGFYTAKVDHRGFIFNGVKTKLFGVNRVEQAPYIGQALSDGAEYRDAYKIKKAGFNAVRLEGGLHANAFLDACDELGLIVINTIPIADTVKAKGELKDNIIKAVRCMARRDRNHTSVVIWEPTPSGINTSFRDKFYIECKKVFKKEFYTEQTLLIAGDIEGIKNPKALDLQLPYTSKDPIINAPVITSLQGRRGLVKKYGDIELGAEYSTSRVGRHAPEGAQLLQAWNYQWTHNRNMASKQVIGDILASNVDYLQGRQEEFKYCYSGLMDIYRLPKFSYQFFRSQDLRPSQRMVFAPTYWDDAGINALPVYSNCEKVRLYINGKLIEERTPDCGETDNYNYDANKEVAKDIKKNKKPAANTAISPTRYWALKQQYEKKAVERSIMVKYLVDNMYNGGNCAKLEQAPFTFRDIVFSEGELKVEGIVGNKIVAKHIVNTPTIATQLKINIDYSAKELTTDKSDFIYVHADIIDDNGSLIRDYNSNLVEFSVDGGEIIGATEVVPISGTASCMLRGNIKADKVTVSAFCMGLKGQRIEVKINSPKDII